MDEQKLREAIQTIEEGLTASRHIMMQLKPVKAMLPNLATQINTHESKVRDALYALADLKKELGL